MIKRFLKWLPALTVSLGMHAATEASPQQKVVDKYNLEERIKNARGEDFRIGNHGCHQPTSEEEIKLYRNFRLIAERATLPDALLLVCDSVQGYPQGVESIYTSTIEKVVRTTPMLVQASEDSQRAVIGHELTHEINHHEVADPSPQINAYVQFEAQFAVELVQLQQKGISFTPEQLYAVAAQEKALQKQAVDAVNSATEKNYPQEQDADIGGLILGAGQGCHIDAAPLTSLLTAMYETFPSWASQGTATHPAFEKRKQYLVQHLDEIRKGCQEYYADMYAGEKKQSTLGVVRVLSQINPKLLRITSTVGLPTEEKKNRYFLSSGLVTDGLFKGSEFDMECATETACTFTLSDRGAGPYSSVEVINNKWIVFKSGTRPANMISAQELFSGPPVQEKKKPELKDIHEKKIAAPPEEEGVSIQVFAINGSSLEQPYPAASCIHVKVFGEYKQCTATNDLVNKADMEAVLDGFGSLSDESTRRITAFRIRYALPLSEKALPSQEEDKKSKKKKKLTKEEFDKRSKLREEFKTNCEEATAYHQSMDGQLARILGALQKMVKPTPAEARLH